MDFNIYTQQKILGDVKLTDYLINTIIENLSYIYGDDMGSEENINMWVDYNLKTDDLSWKVIIGSINNVNLGFIIYTIRNRCLCVNDIEINKDSRFNPNLLGGLFKQIISLECNKFDTIIGYINKMNENSQKNFLKYATTITNKKTGYSFVIDKTVTDKIKQKFNKNS